MNYIGDFAEDSTIYIPITTNDGSGGAVAPSSAFEAADVVIYKDGSATQKTSTNGITMTSPFDSTTGLHYLAIDTSNDTGDAGFWVTGSDYSVILAPDETVDSQTIVAELASFSIENRFNEVDVTAWLGSAPAALTDTDKIQVSLQHGATGVITATLIAADAIGASELAADAVTEIRNAVTGGAYALDTDANGRIRIVDGTGTGELDTSSGLIAGIAGTANTFDDLNDLSTSDIDARLANIGLDHLLAASVTGTDVTDDSIIALLMSASATADFDSYDNTTDSLEAIAGAGGGGAPTAAQVADAVWDEAQSGHVTAGSFGEIATEIAAILVDTGTTLDGKLDTAQADLDIITGADGVNLLSATQASIDAIEADTNELQGDDVPGLIAALNDVSQADITGGAYALDTDANGRIRIVDGTGAGELDTTSGTVLLSSATEAQIDAIEADTNELQSDDVPGLIAALNDIAVSDVLTTQMTESYAANTVAPTLAQSLFAIHQTLMSFAISGTTYSVKKLDNSTEAFQITLNDGTSPTANSRA